MYVCMYVRMYAWCVHVCSPRHHQGALSPCMCVCICVPTAATRGRSTCVTTSTTRGHYPRVCMYSVCVRVPPATTRGRCHPVCVCVYLCSHCCHQGAVSVFHHSHHQGALPSMCPSAPPGGAILVYVCMYSVCVRVPTATTRGRCHRVCVCVYLCSHCCHQGAVSVCHHSHHQGALASCMYVCMVCACMFPLPPPGGAVTMCMSVFVFPLLPPGGAVTVCMCVCLFLCSHCCHQGAPSPCMCVCVFVFPLLPPGGSQRVSPPPPPGGAILMYVCMYVWCVHVWSPPPPPGGAVTVCPFTTRGRCPQSVLQHHQGALSSCVYICVCSHGRHQGAL